jgi:Na+-translocating ferredoxin:NAD+ oxidoreductase RnfD subunit
MPPLASTAFIRFFKTPKGLLTIILALLLTIAIPVEGVSVVAPDLVSACAVAAAIDALILRARRGAWEYPSGAVLTGMIIAMVLSPREPWYVAAGAAALAVVSKYIVRTRSANVFNPAALALVAAAHVVGAGQSWWGALPDTSPIAWIALCATGVFISERVNKIPLVLAFFGVYFVLFTGTAFAGQSRQVAEIYRTPDLQAALYFAFFILTDPPTSPVRHGKQIACGALVAIASYVFFEMIGAADYLLAGVLVGNVWEAWNRNRPSKPIPHGLFRTRGSGRCQNVWR